VVQSLHKQLNNQQLNRGVQEESLEQLGRAEVPVDYSVVSSVDAAREKFTMRRGLLALVSWSVRWLESGFNHQTRLDPPYIASALEPDNCFFLSLSLGTI
jgi:hypothetical protein